MALGTPTSLAAATQAVASTVVTNSFTPTAGALILIFVWMGGDSPTFSVSADGFGGLSWQQAVGKIPAYDGGAIFWAIAPASPGSGTVTISVSSPVGMTTIRPFEITGAQSATPVGYTGGSNASDTINMNGTPASDSMVVSLIGQYTSSNTVFTDPTGYTNLIPYTVIDSFNSKWQAAYKNGSATSSVVWTGGNAPTVAGIAIEVLGSPRPSSPPPAAVVQKAALSRAASW